APLTSAHERSPPTAPWEGPFMQFVLDHSGVADRRFLLPLRDRTPRQTGGDRPTEDQPLSGMRAFSDVLAAGIIGQGHGLVLGLRRRPASDRGRTSSTARARWA